MTRVVVVSVLAAAAIGAAAAAQLLLIPILLAALLGWYSWDRSRKPVATTQQAGRWAIWVVAGAVSIAVAIAIPAIDGGELNGWWWSAMAVAALVGISMLATGLILAVSHRAPRGEMS